MPENPALQVQSPSGTFVPVVFVGQSTAAMFSVKYGAFVVEVTLPEYPSFTMHPEVLSVPSVPGTVPTEFGGHVTAVTSSVKYGLISEGTTAPL